MVATDARVTSPAAIALAVRLCRRSPGPPSSSDLLLLADPAQLHGFHQWAMHQGVLGLVLNQLRRSGALTTLKPEQAQRVLSPLKILRPQALLWSLERDRVVAALRQASIDPVVLKGGALRETAYDDPTDRPVGDLDLLVGESELDRALGALSAAGYRLPADPGEVERFRRDHFHYPLVNPAGFEVELHWGLGQPSALWHLDPAGFQLRAAPVRGTVTAVRVPAPEDMLLHLCTQNVEDSFTKLRRLVDIDRVAAREAVDWEVFAARARAGGMEIIAGLSLHLANRLLAAGLPAELISRMVSSRAARFHLAALEPARGILTGKEPAMDAAHKALAIWLTTPCNRVLQIRNILKGEDEMTHGETTSLMQPARRAGLITSFHVLLWARGLLSLARGDNFWGQHAAMEGVERSLHAP